LPAMGREKNGGESNQEPVKRTVLTDKRMGVSLVRVIPSSRARGGKGQRTFAGVGVRTKSK